MEDKEQHQVKILKKIGDFENVIMRWEMCTEF
jgi:hypothetical protein